MLSSEILGNVTRLLSHVRPVRIDAVRGLSPDDPARGGLPSEIGLYVHVPFCERICRFCPYNKTLFDPELAARYRQALRRELELIGPSLDGRRITSLYIGGGTPTLLPDLVEELAERARHLGAVREIGVEVLPHHATPEMLARLKGAGVDFVSIGVQSFDDEVLSYLGRSHNARDARRAVEAALACGFECVDVDLVFDVGRFGRRGVVRDSEILFDLGAHQLSAYPMMRFGYTPIGRQEGKRHDERQEKIALEEIHRAGFSRGYTRTSVWTFNRRADLRYTSITREFYVGLGPSGSSFVPRAFTVNAFDTRAYIDLIDQGRLPVVFKADVAGRMAMAYYLFWRAYEGRIDRPRFERLFDTSAERVFPGLFACLLALGAVERHGDAYLFTRRGFDAYHSVERWVTYHFIEPLWAACRQTPYPKSLRL